MISQVDKIHLKEKFACITWFCRVFLYGVRVGVALLLLIAGLFWKRVLRAQPDLLEDPQSHLILLLTGFIYREKENSRVYCANFGIYKNGFINLSEAASQGHLRSILYMHAAVCYCAVMLTWLQGNCNITSFKRGKRRERTGVSGVCRLQSVNWLQTHTHSPTPLLARFLLIYRKVFWTFVIP